MPNLARAYFRPISGQFPCCFFRNLGPPVSQVSVKLGAKWLRLENRTGRVGQVGRKLTKAG